MTKPHIYKYNGHWIVRRTLGDDAKQGRDTYDWVCAHLDLFPYIEYGAVRISGDWGL